MTISNLNFKKLGVFRGCKEREKRLLKNYNWNIHNTNSILREKSNDFSVLEYKWIVILLNERERERVIK